MCLVISIINPCKSQHNNTVWETDQCDIRFRPSHSAATFLQGIGSFAGGSISPKYGAESGGLNRIALQTNKLEEIISDITNQKGVMLVAAAGLLQGDPSSGSLCGLGTVELIKK